MVRIKPTPSQDYFGSGAGTLKMDLSDPKSGLFEHHPLNPPTKPYFWPTLWLKVDLWADLGWCITPLVCPVFQIYLPNLHKQGFILNLRISSLNAS